MREYYVYITASRSRTLYVGVTNDLNRRMWQHKHGIISGFSKKYRIDRLVYFDHTPNVTAAIQREKQIKGWTRARKIALIESVNPTWEDLSEGWGEKADPSSLRSSG